MAYQFVRIETYCPKPMPVPHSDDQFNSTEQVFLEAERDPRYSTHVPDPEPPVPIIGFGSIPVPELRALHDAHRAKIRETVTKPDGTTYQRGLKSDFPTLYTEIHSHPMTAADYKAASREEKARVNRWAKLALADFAKRMPKGVKFAAVLHLDEGHVHLHILALNMADPKMRANKLHVGKIAAEEWRREHGRSETLIGLPKPEPIARPNKPKKPKPSKTPATQKKRNAAHAAAVAEWETECGRIDAQNAAALEVWTAKNNAHLRQLRKGRKGKAADVEAYEAALVAFQDRYYETVGRRCGLLRNGPGAERLPTKQYHARKRQARVIAEQEAAMRAEAARQGSDRAQIIAEAKTIASDKAALTRQEGELAARAQALAKREVALSRQETALQAVEDSLKERKQAQARTQRAQDQRAADLEAKETGLIGREEAVKEQEAEIKEAVGAIASLVGQLETGAIRERDGGVSFGRVPQFLIRIARTPPERRSPVQQLVGRFAGLIRRVATAIGGGREIENTEPEARPGP